MLFFKKTLKSLELIEITSYCERIDALNRSIIPIKYLKKKKEK